MRLTRIARSVATAASLLATPALAAGQPLPPAAAAAQPARTGQAAAWTVTIADTFRLETWRFFEPPPGGGDPDYTFAGNRLFVEARRTGARFDVTLAAQHVGMLGLPAGAAGPGALGTGALYFAQGGGRARPQRLYLKYAHVRVRNVAPGLDLRVGRQAYASGLEAAGTDARVNAVKAQRLSSRLVGEFEWSLYQRSFDGVRADWRRGATHVTGAVLMPTQGGFAHEANRTMTDVLISGAAVTLLPASARPHTDLQAFVWHYDDERRVTGRPDNSLRSAARADVAVTTFGGAVVGVYTAGPVEVDVLGWLAAQRGDWYADRHRALSTAAEAGVRWPRVRWSPWVRAGLLHASGDEDGDDGRHGTFFPMLPTVRRFSPTTVYSTMNLGDVFGQVLLQPRAGVSLRLDVRRLTLASAADRWYAGSGATLSSGGNFGYVSRASGGARGLGTAVEASAAWTITDRWSVNGFAGTMSAGPVVRASFVDSRLWFVYFESGLRWQRVR